MVEPVYGHYFRLFEILVVGLTISLDEANNLAVSRAISKEKEIAFNFFELFLW